MSPQGMTLLASIIGLIAVLIPIGIRVGKWSYERNVHVPIMRMVLSMIGMCSLLVAGVGVLLAWHPMTVAVWLIAFVLLHILVFCIDEPKVPKRWEIVSFVLGITAPYFVASSSLAAYEARRMGEFDQQLKAAASPSPSPQQTSTP